MEASPETTTIEQEIVNKSPFLNFMEIDVESLLTGTYDKWPRIRQVLKRPERESLVPALVIVAGRTAPRNSGKSS